LTNQETHDLLRTAIQAARAGNHIVARGILQQVIEQDPDNELAWIWMASVAESTNERRECLLRVLEINPANERARIALQRLQQAATPPAPHPGPTRPAPPSPTPDSRQTPRPDSLVEPERTALLDGQPPRKKTTLPAGIFWIVTILSVMVLTLAILFVWFETQDDEAAESSRPTATMTAPPTVSNGQVSGFRTPTPVGGVLRTLPPRETMPPTWTPTATWTPSPTPMPTSTPYPLNSFMLVVSVQDGEQGLWTLHTLRADGTQERRVSVTLDATSADNPLSLIEAFDADIAPDGQQIVFTGHVSESHLEDNTLVSREFEELFIVSMAGGKARRLTTFEAPAARDAAWSPDGETIAFASNVDGDYDIYLVDVTTGNTEARTRNDALDREPAWSPDGRWLAFSSDRAGPGSTEIWRMPAEGGAVKQLTENVNSSFSPAWSPDGTSIVFLSNRRVNTDLYVMTADGAGERSLIVRDADTEERDPAWSPDSQWIVFSSNREGPFFDLFLIRPDGSDLRRIAAADGDMRFARWHPAIDTTPR